MKPLFCPLKKEYYLQFKSGLKTTEYRAYGPRWNEKTCIINRGVNLSLGYSGERLLATIINYRVISICDAPESVRSRYTESEYISCIDITLDTYKSKS